jgi:hypothetical protein
MHEPGTVTQVRYEVGNGLKPAALVVRAGRNGRCLLVILITEFTTIRTARRCAQVSTDHRHRGNHPAGGPIDEPRWNMGKLLMRLL